MSLLSIQDEEIPMKTAKLSALFALTMLTSLAPQGASAQGDQVENDAPRCDGSDMSSLDQAYCMGEELRDLKTAQERLVARIHELLRGKGPELTDYASAAGNLDEAQQHWRAFIVADCAVGENVFGAGSAFALDSANCEINHYQHRNDELEAFKKDYLND